MKRFDAPGADPPAAHWGEVSPLHDPWILAHFEARPSDVLITTAPKAGTTWMQQILHQLRSGGDPDFRDIDDVVPWLERQRAGRDWHQVLADFEALPDPRVFKTHCTWEQTPGRDTARIILTLRDPRDCCVSFYHHLMDMTDAALSRTGLTRPATMDDHVSAWLDFGAWFRNVGSWWPRRGRDNVLMLRYADLKAELPAAMEQILGFLGWTATVEELARAREYASFPWMKANAHRFVGQGEDGKPVFRPGGFIRQGRTGDYRTHLSPAQEARILARARADLPVECLAWLGLEEAGGMAD